MIPSEFGSMDGIKIIANPHMPETVKQQYKFPRSKKKRIRKKWARNPKYRREVPAIWQMGRISDCASQDVRETDGALQ